MRVDRSTHRKSSQFVYDFIKFISRHLLPVVGTTYFVVALLWDISDSFYVLGFILSAQMVLGFVLTILADVYDLDHKNYVGDIVMGETADGPKIYTFEMTSEPDGMEKLNEVTFRIKNKTTST